MSIQTRRKFLAGMAAATTGPAFADSNPDAVHLIAIGDWGAPPEIMQIMEPPQKRKWQKMVAAAAAAYLEKEKIVVLDSVGLFCNRLQSFAS